jgi:hypothetical protein
MSLFKIGQSQAEAPISSGPLQPSCKIIETARYWRTSQLEFVRLVAVIVANAVCESTRSLESAVRRRRG